MTGSPRLVPIILSGGTGSRLWPISRESHPKPFMILPDGLSLLQKTFSRARSLIEPADIITITNKTYYLKSKAEYEKDHTFHGSLSYLLEPEARNTAPAIALAALYVSQRFGADAILFILPADHLVNHQTAFVTAAQQAVQLAQQDLLVTLGVTPTAPETGFGYIECNTDNPLVKRFVEKPDADTAKDYIASNRFLWNSGMFCFKAGVILQEIQTLAPDLYQAAYRCWQNTMKQSPATHVLEFDQDTFSQIESISIDYAIMEKSKRVAVVRGEFDWQDIGSWQAYQRLFETDTQGNTILGDAILIDSHNNFIHSEGRMVASIGIQNLAIIDTPDAVLITSRDRSQEVKQIVQTLKHQAHESYLTHRTVIRPWGSYTVLEEGPHFKIKRIIVKPGASLSLQQHQHRSEHWVVIEGTAKIVNGDQEQLLHVNESTFVPMGTPHRLSNPTDNNLVIIEVQTGQYVGEDDIVRFEDNYGRLS